MYLLKWFTKLMNEMVSITRPKSEEHMLVVLDKSSLGKNLCQPLQAKNKQYKNAITFSSRFNGIFNSTPKK